MTDANAAGPQKFVSWRMKGTPLIMTDVAWAEIRISSRSDRNSLLLDDYLFIIKFHYYDDKENDDEQTDNYTNAVAAG